MEESYCLAWRKNRRNYDNLPEDSRTDWAVCRLNSECRREQRHKTVRAQQGNVISCSGYSVVL